MSQKSGRRVIGLRPFSFTSPHTGTREFGADKELVPGSKTLGLPSPALAANGGAADDHLHDIQWLQGFCVLVLLAVLVLTAHGHRRLSVCLWAKIQMQFVAYA